MQISALGDLRISYVGRGIVNAARKTGKNYRISNLLPVLEFQVLYSQPNSVSVRHSIYRKLY